YRKARVRIARPRLVQRNASQRGTSAREETLWQGNDRRERRLVRRGKSQRDGIAIGRKDAHASRARKAPTSFNRRIRRILKEEPGKAGARSDLGVCNAHVRAVEASFRRIGGIIPRVAEPGRAELRYQRWLVEQRNFVRGNVQIAHCHLAKGIAVQDG